MEQVPTPTPGPGELLVRVAACGLCRTDLEHLKEGMRPLREPPLILGHETSGTVAGAGAGVAGFREGDPVLVACFAPCNRCSYCQEGRDNLCPNADIPGGNRDGGLAEYVVVPAAGVFPLPRGSPVQESAVLADAFATPYHALVGVGHMRSGESVAIYGASGGLGLAAVQIASALGGAVVGIGRQPWKLERALGMGARAVVSTSEFPRPEAEVNRLTGGGAHLSLDATGAPEMIAAACRATRPGGRIVVMGYGVKEVTVPLHRLMWLEYAVLGSRTYRLADLASLLTLVEQGQIHPGSIVSHRFPLDQVNQGYKMLEEGRVLRAIVIP